MISLGTRSPRHWELNQVGLILLLLLYHTQGGVETSRAASHPSSLTTASENHAGMQPPAQRADSPKVCIEAAGCQEVSPWMLAQFASAQWAQNNGTVMENISQLLGPSSPLPGPIPVAPAFFLFFPWDRDPFVRLSSPCLQDSECPTWG